MSAALFAPFRAVPALAPVSVLVLVHRYGWAARLGTIVLVARILCACSTSLRGH